MAKAFPNTGVTTGTAADRAALSGMFEGQHFYETDSNKVFVYSGSAWVEVNDLDSTDGVTTSAQSKLDNIGLVHITTVEMPSLATSLNIDNCFDSTYQNYVIYLNTLDADNNTIIHGRMRLSGTDASGASDYVRMLHGIRSNGVAFNSTGSGSLAYFMWTNVASPTRAFAQIFVCNPANAIPTTLNVQMGGLDSTSSATITGTNFHTQSIAYDGISFLNGTGNMKLCARIFGIRNA